MPSRPIAIVDAGALYAGADEYDPNHARCAEVLRSPHFDLVVPALVLAEASYLIGQRLGAAVEAALFRSLDAFEVEPPLASEWSRIADLVDQYADVPLGGTDASIVALAERLDTELIVTLDRRHFGAVKPRHCAAFRLLPE